MTGGECGGEWRAVADAWRTQPPKTAPLWSPRQQLETTLGLKYTHVRSTAPQGSIRQFEVWCTVHMMLAHTLPYTYFVNSSNDYSTVVL
jgi:hypothetical protein